MYTNEYMCQFKTGPSLMQRLVVGRYSDTLSAIGMGIPRLKWLQAVASNHLNIVNSWCLAAVTQSFLTKQRDSSTNRVYRSCFVRHFCSCALSCTAWVTVIASTSKVKGSHQPPVPLPWMLVGSYDERCMLLICKMSSSAEHEEPHRWTYSVKSSATSMDACRFIWWKTHAVNMQNELISRAWGTTQVNLFSEVTHHSKHKKLFTLGSDIILAEMALPLPQGPTILCCNQMCKDALWHRMVQNLEYRTDATMAFILPEPQGAITRLSLHMDKASNTSCVQ
jgi:hypothetical protein